MEALTERAAALPTIELGTPRALIGKTTIDAIRAGIVYGYAGMVDGILARLRDELGEETHMLATGGLASAIVPFCDSIERGRRPAHAQRAAAHLGAEPSPRLGGDARDPRALDRSVA